MIEPYYSEIFSKSFSQEASSSWHRRKRQTGKENFDAKKTEDGASNDRLSKLFSISKSEQTGAGKRHGDSIEHLYRRDRSQQDQDFSQDDNDVPKNKKKEREQQNQIIAIQKSKREIY